MEKQMLVNTWLKGNKTCLEDSPYPYRITCITMCTVEAMIDLCNCSLPISELAFKRFSFNHSDELKIHHHVCSPLEWYECIQNFEEQIQDATNDCRSKCLMPCNTISYSNDYSIMSFSDEEKSNKSHILLGVIFESFDVTVTEEIITVTAASVLANVGGAMGVFIGASMISMVELLSFLVQCFSTLFSCKKP